MNGIERWMFITAVLACTLAGCGGTAVTPATTAGTANGVPALSPDPAIAYRVVDLGDFMPRSINRHATIAGSEHGVAAAYAAGTVTNLGTYPGDDSSIANAINDSGEIVGSSGDGKHAVVFRSGSLPSLLVSPRRYPYAQALAVNDEGEVVGAGIPVSGCVTALQFASGGGRPAAYNGLYAVAVNDQGTIVENAYTFTAHECAGAGYVETVKPKRRIPAPSDNVNLDEGGGMQASAMNARGAIVGSYTFCKSSAHPAGCDIAGGFHCRSGASTCGTAGFYAYAGKVTPIYSPLPHRQDLQLNAINDGGTIVGAISSKDHGIAVIVNGQKTVVPLHTLVAANAGWTFVSAVAINDEGAIAGSGLYHGHPHGFLLEPGGNAP